MSICTISIHCIFEQVKVWQGQGNRIRKASFFLFAV